MTKKDTHIFSYTNHSKFHWSIILWSSYDTSMITKTSQWLYLTSSLTPVGFESLKPNQKEKFH